MGTSKGTFLSRDEIDLVRYYRGLSSEQQFEILEQAETRFNVSRRMEELAGRGLRILDGSGPAARS